MDYNNNWNFIKEDIESIIKILHIDFVCIKIIKNDDVRNIKLEHYEVPKSELRHCQIVDIVRRNHESICTTEKEHKCKGGAAAIGLCKLPENIMSGIFYFNTLGHFDTLNAAKKTIDNISLLYPYSSKYVIYFNLHNEENLIPDVVLFFVNPKKAMLLTQAYLYSNGGNINCEFSGKQSFCSDSIAYVLNHDKPNITMGCSGSRSYTNINDNELIFSFPVSLIHQTSEGLKNIFK